MAFEKTKQKMLDAITEPMKPIALLAAAAIAIACIALIVAVGSAHHAA